MTKNTKKITKENRRSKSKYPALNKGMNLSSRKDYIEPEYVDGVYDKEGKQIIRPLNEEEKAWLNQFYEETVVTNFYHDPDLKKLNKLKKSIIEDETVQTLIKEIKKLESQEVPDKKRIRELREIVKLTKKQNEEIYAEKLENIEDQLQDIRKEKLLYPDKEDHKTFYNSNNSRNNCIFNKSKITNKLSEFETEKYDTFLADRLEGLDAQQILIYELERELYEEQEDKIEEILQEVKKHIKKKTKSSQQ